MIYVIKVTLGKDWSFYKRPYQGWDWTCKELKIVKIKVKMVFKNEFKDSKSNLKTFLRVLLKYEMILKKCLKILMGFYKAMEWFETCKRVNLEYYMF